MPPYRPVVRVLIVAESFLPDVNGVTNSVLRVIEHLERRGHDALVIAPGLGVGRYHHAGVERVPAVARGWFRELSVGLPVKRHVQDILRDYQPDVVYLAAPVVLGAAGAAA